MEVDCKQIIIIWKQLVYTSERRENNLVLTAKTSGATVYIFNVLYKEWWCSQKCSSRS